MDTSDKNYYSGNDVCDRRDMKLQEAEKTIANKDVLITMLQQHVKKLEQSYKQNLNETESYRYKYCLVSEQVKRLRGACPRNREKQSMKLKCDLNKWKQQCEALTLAKERCSGCPGKHSYLQQIQNVERVMKAHYELLKKIIDNTSEKDDSVDGEFIEITPSNPETTKLQQEIERLKEENAKLQERINSEPFENVLQIKDSVLGTYQHINSELQKRMSVLPEDEIKVSNESIVEELPNDTRRVSFSPRESLNSKQIVEEKVSDHDENLNESEVQKNNETLVNVPSDSLKSSEDVESTKLPKSVTSICDCINKNNVGIIEKAPNGSAEIFTTMSAISEKINTISEAQNAMSKTIDEIKEELKSSVAQSLIEKLNEQIENLSKNVNEQNSKMEHLLEIKHPVQENPITNEKCNEDKTDLSQKLDALMDESVEKDKKIKCLNAHLKYYQQLRDNVEAMQPGSNKCCEEELEKMHQENMKMKTTVSSVINHLNQKMCDLKSMQEKETTCCCDNSSEDELRSDLEIEEIYNVVRQAFMSNSQPATTPQNSCLCFKDMFRSSHECDCNKQNNLEEIYNSVLDRCRSKCEKTPSKNVSRCSQVKQCESEHCDNLVSNLGSYIGYLHEQLNIISNIEDRIEFMRNDVKIS